VPVAQDYRSEAAAAGWHTVTAAATPKKVAKIVTFGGPSPYAVLDMDSGDTTADEALEAEEKAKDNLRIRDILSTAEKAATDAREAAAAASRP